MNQMYIRQNHCRGIAEIQKEGFVTRTEFINRTGIFVTPKAFEDICERFADAHADTDEFIEHYEERYSIAVQTDRTGVIKYEDYDFAGIGYKPNAYELLNWNYCK